MTHRRPCKCKEADRLEAGLEVERTSRVNVNVCVCRGQHWKEAGADSEMTQDVLCKHLQWGGSELYRRRQLRKNSSKWNSDSTDSNGPVQGKRQRHFGNQSDCTKKSLIGSDFKKKYKKKIKIEYVPYEYSYEYYHILTADEHCQYSTQYSNKSPRFLFQFLFAFASSNQYLKLPSEHCS